MSVKTYDEFMNKIVYCEYLFSFEPIFEIDEGTIDEERLLLQTLFSVGQFFEDGCEENNSMALDACRRYASYQSKDNSRVYKANSLYDILL